VKLEINADDVGMTQRINNETFDLVSRGLVNSCSIIVNAPFAAEAIGNSAAFPHCRFGVHLNISDFAPISPTMGLKPLLQQNGQFSGNVLWRHRITKSLKHSIYIEWAAQIDRCIDIGLRPAHLDSHHDIHLHRKLIPVVQRLQRRYGISRVRRGHNVYRIYAPLRQRLRDELWSAVFTATGSRVPHYVTSLADFRRAVHRGWLNSRLASKNVRVEIVVHPGNDYCSEFIEETELLRSGWVEQFRDTAYGTPELTQPGAQVPIRVRGTAS
jgi:chitin disaccharide deacetylase